MPASTSTSCRDKVSWPTNGRHGVCASAAMYTRSKGRAVRRGSPPRMTEWRSFATSITSGNALSNSGPEEAHACVRGSISTSCNISFSGGRRFRIAKAWIRSLG
eukprot:scaffold294459_cov33-Tisochrysis_lutea.AAC.2